jgi:hypothetical protein
MSNVLSDEKRQQVIALGRLAFTLFVSALVASWGLWLVAQFRDASPYKEIGNFTTFSSLLLLAILIVIFSIRFRARDNICAYSGPKRPLIPEASALGRSVPVVLSKSEPWREQD